MSAYRTRLLAIVAALSAVLAGAQAADAYYIAVAEDPTGDAADPNPSRDIRAIGMLYDRRSGELFGGVQLAGEPAEETRAFVSLFAGTRTASGCNGVPAAGFGSYSDEFGASWLRVDDPAGNGPRGDADKTGYLSAIQEFQVADRQLSGQRFDCVTAMLTEPSNGAHVYDSVGPIDLVAQPALSLRVSGARQTFRSNRPRTIKLTLSNPGDAPTRRVRLKLSRARGMTATLKPRSLKPIAPGRRKTVTATITLSSSARTLTDVTITATAGRLRAREEASLYLRKGSGKRPSGGGDHTPGVCNRWQPDLSGETGGSLNLVPC